MQLNSLKKKKVSKKLVETIAADFNNGTPSLKFIGSTDESSNIKFLFNGKVKHNEYIAVCEIDEQIIIITNNYDEIDITPRKIKVNKNLSFYSKNLQTLLEKYYIFVTDSIFELEEVFFGEDEHFIGYHISNLITNNQQQNNNN